LRGLGLASVTINAVNEAKKTPTRPARVSDNAVHQRRRRLAGAGLLAFAAIVVWAIASVGGGGDSGPQNGGFAARLASVGGTGPGSLFATQAKLDRTAVSTTYKQTPYIVKAGGQRRAVALTFDDGPSEYTPQYLKILNQMGAAATFFTVGGQYSTFGPTVKRAHSDGYVVADHTWTHPQMPSLGSAEQSSEIDRTASAITGLGLPSPQLYRPPYGAYDQTTLDALKKRKMLLVLWDVDTEDWRKPGVDAIKQAVFTQVQPGSIILMHDGGGDRTQTLAALPDIIRGLRERGYQLVTVPRLLAEDPPRGGDLPPAPNGGA